MTDTLPAGELLQLAAAIVRYTDGCTQNAGLFDIRVGAVAKLISRTSPSVSVPTDEEIEAAAFDHITYPKSGVIKDFIAGVRWLLDWQKANPPVDVVQLVEAINNIQDECTAQTKALSKQGITSGHRVFEINRIWHMCCEALAAYDAAQQKAGA